MQWQCVRYDSSGFGEKTAAVWEGQEDEGTKTLRVHLNVEAPPLFLSQHTRRLWARLSLPAPRLR